MTAKTITQADLDAMPEMGTWSLREEIHNGQLVRIPVLNGPVGVLWTDDDEPCAVIDNRGVGWRIGWINGVRYKKRATV